MTQLILSRKFPADVADTCLLHHLVSDRDTARLKVDSGRCQNVPTRINSTPPIQTRKFISHNTVRG